MIYFNIGSLGNELNVYISRGITVHQDSIREGTSLSMITHHIEICAYIPSLTLLHSLTLPVLMSDLLRDTELIYPSDYPLTYTFSYLPVLAYQSSLIPVSLFLSYSESISHFVKNYHFSTMTF